MRDTVPVRLRIPPAVEIELLDGRRVCLAATPRAFVRFQMRRNEDPLRLFSGTPDVAALIELLYYMVVGDLDLTLEQWQELLPWDPQGYAEILKRLMVAPGEEANAPAGPT